MPTPLRITTDHLVLREFVFDDWAAVLAYQQDPRYLRLYPWTDRTKADARDFVRMFVDWQVELPRRKFQLAITLPDGGRLIGNCGIRRKPENNWEADIGYELAPDYWAGDMPRRRLGPWSALDSGSCGYTGFRPGVSLKTPLR